MLPLLSGFLLNVIWFSKTYRDALISNFVWLRCQIKPDKDLKHKNGGNQRVTKTKHIWPHVVFHQLLISQMRLESMGSEVTKLDFI